MPVTIPPLDLDDEAKSILETGRKLVGNRSRFISGLIKKYGATYSNLLQKELGFNSISKAKNDLE